MPERDTGHTNEQWQDYWAGLFAKHDYVALNCLRLRTTDVTRGHQQTVLAGGRGRMRGIPSIKGPKRRQWFVSSAQESSSRQIYALAAGYLVVWSAFSPGATALQRLLAGLINPINLAINSPITR